MEIHDYIDLQKAIQFTICQFVSSEIDIEEHYQNLVRLINNLKNHYDSHELQTILYLIIKISNNHNRPPFFISKIESIISLIKNDIKQNFTNHQIFTIFKSNKRLLLYLIQEKILILDKFIVNAISKGKYAKWNYISYFYPETKEFLEENDDTIKVNYGEFDAKRKIGENDSYICEMIRKDLIDEFISYVNQNSISLNTTIDDSIFETNPLLLKKECTLIEYSAFFGSTQIFKYLYLNGSRCKTSLWIYVVHGDDPEMIHFLEENRFEMTENSLNGMYIESIKCHHNEIATYIESNYINKEELDGNIIGQSIRYFNYIFFPDNLNNILFFKYLCHYNYLTLSESILEIFPENVIKKIKKSCLNIAAKKGNIEIIDLFDLNDITDYFFECPKSLHKVEIHSNISFINNYAFKDCSLMNQISIPSSVKKIGKCAFKGCKSLKEIKIPSSVVSICESAFQECSSLTEILIPSSVKKIGQYCFCGCSSIEQISISPFVTEIEKNTFCGCSSLKNVSIPSSVVSIGDYAFNGCLSMREISIPLSVKSIGNYAFSVCSSLQNIEIPSSVVSIGDYCFRGCSSLIHISLSSSVSSIGEDVFRGCLAVESIEIPPSVTSIGDFSFRGCKSLKQILIPSSVSSIGRDAFKGCKALKKIEIPASVSFIGIDAFKDCNTLRQISIPSNIESTSRFGIRPKAKIIRT